MRNLKSNLILISLLVAILSGCENKEEESQGSIVGSWKAVSMSSSNGDWSTSYENIPEDYIYEFKSDGTCMGNVAVLELIPSDGYWTLTDDELVISGIDFIVEKLDAQNLVLHEIWQDGTNYYEIIFKRVD